MWAVGAEQPSARSARIELWLRSSRPAPATCQAPCCQARAFVDSSILTVLVVRNHGGDAATLDAGRALVVLRRYAA